jgi:hypothetical protein
MRFLIDETMSSPVLASRLRAQGHDPVLGRDVRLPSVADPRVLIDRETERKAMPNVHRIFGAFNIEHYPTIFGLDPSGVIRYREIRGEALQRAVNTLRDVTVQKLARFAGKCS